ncbi:MAG: gliding motility-associated C-terminal domain-containing protein [Chitinophagaceae bacterium]|nr:gliding motility-associated C-terminal domain-containing protein [Chitinophagaceae bacterium]
MRSFFCMLTCILLLFSKNSHSQATGNCTLPDSLFARDTLIICSDTAYSLTVNYYTGTTYLWSTGSIDTFTQVMQTGKYWVRIADNKCVKTDSVFLIFNSLIQAPEIDTSILCLKNPAIPLRAEGLNLLWYDSAIGGAGRTTAPVPSTDSLGEKLYYVSQTIMGCESPRAAALVEVIDKPKFDLGKNILIPCGALGITLQVVAQKYTEYMWRTGDEGPVYDAPGPGTYVLRAQNICGNLTDTVIAVDCDTKCVRFPSAFTPNGDGLNDIFRPISFCPIDKYKLVIFNRFGEKVFDTNNPSDAWNGTWQGKKQVPGNFVYFCQYNDFVLKKEIMFKGTITLIK